MTFFVCSFINLAQPYTHLPPIIAIAHIPFLHNQSIEKIPVPSEPSTGSIQLGRPNEHAQRVNENKSPYNTYSIAGTFHIEFDRTPLGALVKIYRRCDVMVCATANIRIMNVSFSMKLLCCKVGWEYILLLLMYTQWL